MLDDRVTEEVFRKSAYSTKGKEEKGHGFRSERRGCRMKTDQIVWQVLFCETVHGACVLAASGNSTIREIVLHISHQQNSKRTRGGLHNSRKLGLHYLQSKLLDNY